METKRNKNFHRNMASDRKKLQKSTNGNTKLDKKSIVELMKVVFKEEFLKQQQDI